MNRYSDEELKLIYEVLDTAEYTLAQVQSEFSCVSQEEDEDFQADLEKIKKVKKLLLSGRTIHM